MKPLIALFATVVLCIPAHAETIGGIELGGTGIKATVVEATGEGDTLDIAVKFTDTTNTSLAAGIAKDGRFDADALKDSAAAVKKYQERFQSEFKVDPKRIIVVGSSGLFAAITGKNDLIKENQDKLTKTIKDATGLTMNFITVTQEAELSIAGTLPKSRRAKGLLIDIGGGNTKGGYQTEPGKYGTFGIPFGTTTFAEFAKKNNAADGKALWKLCQENVCPLLKQELGKLADLDKKDRVYLTGGVVWAVATYVHPSDARSYVPLTSKELEAFEAKLLADPKAMPELDVSAIKDPKKVEAAQLEAAKVKKVYPPERVLAGVQILKAVHQELESGKSERQVYFAKHGYLGWLLAYVAEAAEK